MSAVPILWLHDMTAGDGKSGIGWELLTACAADGVSTAYVDLEYVATREPRPADDPGNHLVKIRMLATMWPAFRADGVQCLVAFASTGVAGVGTGLRELIPDAVVVTCRAVDSDTTDVEQVGVADVTVETTGLDLEEAAAAIRRAAAGWPLGALAQASS